MTCGDTVRVIMSKEMNEGVEALERDELGFLGFLGT